MQTSTHIHALAARYVLPRPHAGAQARLDRLLRRMLDEALEPALERAGVPLHAEVCLREISSRLTLDLGASDDALILKWSLELAAVIAAAVADPGPTVVVFGSLHHALAELTADVATGTLARAWAYRQLGLGELAHVGAPQRISLLVGALERTPAAIVAILAKSAERGQLTALRGRLTPAHWLRLARAAARTHDALAQLDILLREATSAPGPGDMSQEPSMSRPPGPLVRTLAADPGVASSPEARAAASLLCALASEPGHPDVRLAQARSTLRTLRPTPTPRGTPDEPPPPRSTALTTSLPIASDPEPTPRPRADTHHGGLLFLVHLLAPLITTVTTTDAYPGRPLRWVLHRWALALAPIPATDPAALAFAGLAPDARPPSVGEPPPTPAELERITLDITSITTALHLALGEPAIDPTHLRARVCQRFARVVADPGWIELHLSLREVDTDLRKAGLDLDPGFVPWLGAVVKFVYA